MEDLEFSKTLEEAFTRLNAVFPDETHELRALLQKKEGANLSKQGRAKQLSQFITMLDYLVADLRVAHRENRVMAVAWVARCLVEIEIWIRYCNASEENAKRFSDDTLRDMYGYSTGVQKLERASDLKPRMAELQEALKDFAKSGGIDKLSDDFKRVHEAAEELGEKDLFSGQNKIFSKLAHPTAFSLQVAFSPLGESSLRHIIMLNGIGHAVAALEHLKHGVETSYRKS